MIRNTLLFFQISTTAVDLAVGGALESNPQSATLLGLAASSPESEFRALFGAILFALGLAGAFGVFLLARRQCAMQPEIVWLITATMRSALAIFLGQQVLAGAIGASWSAVVLWLGIVVLVQAIGLRRRWLRATPSTAPIMPRSFRPVR